MAGSSDGAVKAVHTKYKKGRRRVGGFDIFLFVFLTLLALLCLFPFYNVVLLSFAEQTVAASHPVYVVPLSFTLNSYYMICRETAFLRSLLVTLAVVALRTTLNIVLTTTGAYALSKKAMPGRNIMLSLIVFTMFFGGGLIPWYLVLKELGLINRLASMIIPSAISTFNLILMKNYFNTLNPGFEESARIDGANDIYILFRIIIPMSMPMIATITLFYAVGAWNEWYSALILISEPKLYPLQIYLRNLLILFNVKLEYLQQYIKSTQKIFNTGIQMAAIVLSTIPILCVYPFLQKYFVKGLIIGSFKE